MTIPAPVLMRNTKPGPTVFHDELTKTDVTWQGAGDPNGLDVQAVPRSYLENVNFIGILSRGILSLEEASSDVASDIDQYMQSPAIQRQASIWKAEHESTQQAAVDRIDVKVNNDIVTVPCQGPSTRGAGECGNDVAVRESAKGEAPALCQSHLQLEGQYVMVETDQVRDGQSVKTWKRVGIDAKQQHHSTS